MVYKKLVERNKGTGNECGNMALECKENPLQPSCGIALK
jgi:hypothetical protein